MLTTTTRADGDTLVTSIPAEITRALRLAPGAELIWLEDGQGGYRIVPAGEKTGRILEAHEAAISTHRDVFRVLAK